ncbi:MAG: hypothetical protein HN878_00545, partial [Candidatus Diapherotrites archaeon]|nr:hypothetical protein [Candidatus Diapherotrites archaeon]
FNVEKANQPVNTGGNLNYWNGAAKSIDFTGSYAVNVYNDTADSRIDGTDYGFEWSDITQNGTLYLKTFFYTPTDSTYTLVADSGSFWTPDEEFNDNVPLRGIKGMSYNSQANNSKVETLQDIFDFVQNGDICVSNDGQTTSFWWNEYVLANTIGMNDSQYNKEVALAGSS